MLEEACGKERLVDCRKGKPVKIHSQVKLFFQNI